MRLSRLLVSATATVALAVTAVAIGVTANSAFASIPPAVPGNINVLGNGPRIVPWPGTVVQGGVTKTFKVAGETFDGKHIPANATSVTLSVSSVNPADQGHVKVWTTDAGKPGTPAFSWTGFLAPATAFVTVGLNSEGKFNVESSVKTNIVMAILNYVTPVPAPAAPVIKTLPAVDRAPIQVGGSIRLRSTLLGKVTLGAGTWDARVLTSFTGFNASNNTVPADVRLTGTVVLAKGDAEEWAFPALATNGGVEIPDAQSTTLTQDPTPSISTFLTLTEETVVSVRVFAYASDSSTAGSGELKAGLDAATFVKLS